MNPSRLIASRTPTLPLPPSMRARYPRSHFGQRRGSTVAQPIPGTKQLVIGEFVCEEAVDDLVEKRSARPGGLAHRTFVREPSPSGNRHHGHVVRQRFDLHAMQAAGDEGVPAKSPDGVEPVALAASG